ncbi:hypothetical protein GURASL_24970 [Geotalea uraniireducens]|uniref:Uncharacterized protein n=1 Tax=Geotalea uraniireducens TaxID=351604 RepID=A0ABN6VU27_9BACT|nr:hypothetical protein GURASL_24970 [Geotalea uraniireducens]
MGERLLVMGAEKEEAGVRGQGERRFAEAEMFTIHSYPLGPAWPALVDASDRECGTDTAGWPDDGARLPG